MSSQDPSVGEHSTDVGPSAVEGSQPALASPTDSARQIGDRSGREKTGHVHTRLSGYWSALVVGLVVLLVFIIFILENSEKVDISFFGTHTHLAEGAALLLAAVVGGLVVVFAGTARILQLRSRGKRKAPSSR